MSEDSYKILGFDVGGTKISAVIGDSQGRIIRKLEKPTSKNLGQERLAEQLRDMGWKAMESAGINSVESIGIIFAGLIDQASRTVINSPNIPGMRRFPVGKMLEEEFGVRSVLENDATGATIAERLFGSGRFVDNFAYITLSTGIGGGFFSGGKLVRGAHGLAGEFGHMVIMANGPICGCGRRGCLEAIAGGKGIARRATESLKGIRESEILSSVPINRIDAKVIFDAMEKGDMFSRLIVEETVYYLAVGIVNIASILDPELVIIGGGLTNSGQKFIDLIKRGVREEFKNMKRPMKIVKAIPHVSDLASISLPIFFSKQDF